MITIKDHLIDNESGELKLSLHETPNHSGLFTAGLPDTIVMHYTGGGSYTSSVNWLCNEAAGASAHLVVGRKGEIAQLLPFNKIAWHAGKSSWQERTSLNHYSIGIELANAGLLSKRANGYYTSFGTKVNDDQVVLARHKNRSTVEAWEAYTPKQLEVAEALCIALKQQYGIKEIVGHDDIAPSRKTDTGPAFPMEQLRNKVLFGRMDNQPEEALIADQARENKGLVLASRLNIRSSPVAGAPTVAEPLHKGTRLTVLEQDGQWLKVKVVTEGWVSKDYVDIVG